MAAVSDSPLVYSVETSREGLTEVGVCDTSLEVTSELNSELSSMPKAILLNLAMSLLYCPESYIVL